MHKIFKNKRNYSDVLSTNKAWIDYLLDQTPYRIHFSKKKTNKTFLSQIYTSFLRTKSLVTLSQIHELFAKIFIAIESNFCFESHHTTILISENAIFAKPLNK